VYEFDQFTDFREHVGPILREPGPTFVSLRVNRGPSGPFPTIRYVEMACNLEKALK
jgi:hypothetical protein